MRPISLTSFNGLEIEIESTENTDFEEWMNSETSKDKIELQIFYPYLEGGSKIMTFYDCYLVGFQTIFSNNDYEPMKDRLRITSGGVKAPYSEIEYTTSWRKTFTPKQGKGRHFVKETSNQKKEIIKCYLVEKKNKSQKIRKIETGQKVILKLETQNMIGDIISINLKNPRIDFKYRSNKLENDILSGFEIKDDYHEIELETIKEFKQ